MSCNCRKMVNIKRLILNVALTLGQMLVLLHSNTTCHLQQHQKSKYAPAVIHDKLVRHVSISIFLIILHRTESLSWIHDTCQAGVPERFSFRKRAEASCRRSCDPGFGCTHVESSPIRMKH